jgi:DNA-binding beta-propeller fold protein YncE
VTESLTGVLGVALGGRGTGALELLDGSTATVVRTVALGAPAREVVVGSDGGTFYVLNGTAAASSVTIVDSQDGRVKGTVPVPLDTVSIVPDVQETAIYALQPNGHVSQVAAAGGRIITNFPIGASGHSLALSPDGSTLFALKGATDATNVAVVDLATESVRKVLPAPSNCLQVLVSANGNQLYQVAGTAGYGNIQVFAI